MNEAFKRRYSPCLEEQIDASAKGELRRCLTESVKNINQYDLRLVESAMQSAIESLHPDKSWWEVTSCNITESLFNDGVESTINAIIEGIADNEITESKSINESVVDLSKAKDAETKSFSMSDGDYVRLGEDDFDNEELAKQLKSQGYVMYRDTEFASGRDITYVKGPVNEAVSNPEKTISKVDKNLSKEVDKDLVRDLTLCIENDGEVYRRSITPVIKNLRRKRAKGQFDEKLAIQAFFHVVEGALKMPHFYRYYTYSIKTVSVPERYAVAKELLDGAMDEIEFEDVNENLNLSTAKLNKN